MFPKNCSMRLIWLGDLGDCLMVFRPVQYNEKYIILRIIYSKALIGKKWVLSYGYFMDMLWLSFGKGSVCTR